MAEKVTVDLGLGTGFDASELEKGLSEAEQAVIKSAQKMFEDVEKSAQKQTEAIRKEEAEKIEIIKKSMDEQIKAIKSTDGLSGKEKQAQIKVIKETENAKIKTVREGAKLQEKAVRDMAANQTKIYRDSAKKQLRELQNGYKRKAEAVRDFAQGAIRELMGMDQILASVAGGPAAIGKMIVDMGKQAIAELNKMAEEYRQLEQAEIALAKAAQHNPYLNERSVRQLNAFANEMQRVTGIDNATVLQQQTLLASMGRSQEQIQMVMKTAADMAAAGMMNFDQAVYELGKSFNGVVGRITGVLAPEVKKFTDEQMAAGAAVEYLAKRVEGQAAEAMRSGAGSVQAYENAVSNLRREIGKDWEEAVAPMRRWLTGVIERWMELNDVVREYNRLSKLAREGGITSAGDRLAFLEAELAVLRQMSDDQIIGNYGEERGITPAQRRERDELRRQQHRESIANLVERIEKERELAEIESAAQAVRARAATARDKGIGLEPDQLARFQEAHRLAEMARREADAADRLRRDSDLEGARAANARAEAHMRESEALIAAVEQRMEEEAKVVDFRKENEKALDAEIEKIIRTAEIRNEITTAEAARLRANSADEGVLNNHLSLRKQILDAQIQAYENLLNVANDYLTAEEKDDAVRMLRAKWAEYSRLAEIARQNEEDEKQADAARAQRLAELVRLQEDAQKNLDRILSEVQDDARVINEERIQREIADVRQRNAKKGIEKQAQYELNQLQNINAEKRNELTLQYQRELNAHTELMERIESDTKLTEDEKTAMREKALTNRMAAEENHRHALVQLAQNTADREKQIEEEKNRALKEMRLAQAQEYLAIANQMASSISTTWHNIIDYQTQEHLRKNDEMIQSDEDRAHKEKEILIRSAYEKYKADLIAWGANVLLATAQAAIATLNALAKGPAMATLVGIASALQVATVVSAKPKPPRYHTGGVVQGRAGQERLAMLMAGETVTTQKQFNNVMQAFANVANARLGGSDLNVKVINNAANTVTTSHSLDPEGLRITIDAIVQDSLATGRYDRALGAQRSHAAGLEFG